MFLRSSMQRVLSSLLMLNLARTYRGKASLIKIETARSYVLGVRKARTFILGTVLTVIALMFLASGLILIQFGIFLYTDWSKEVRLTIALLIGGVELLGALGLLFYVFGENTWIKFFGIPALLGSINKKKDKGNGKVDSHVA